MRMRRKRILYVEQSRVGTTGGSHTCLLDLMRGLNRQKYELFVMFYEQNTLLEEFSGVVDRVIVYQKPRMLDIRRAMPTLGSRWLLPFFCVLTAVQKVHNLVACVRPFLDFHSFLRKERIDLVHLNNSFYLGYDWLIASKLCRVKCITHQRGLQAAPLTGKLFVRLYDMTICVSEHIRQVLKENGFLVAARACVIYDGVDVKSFTGRIRRGPASVRREFGVRDSEPLIGIVGNIKPWKGHAVVIDAVSLLKAKYDNMRCVLIGDPAENPGYFESLKNAVISQELVKNVLFVGFRDDVPELMRALDIVLHASIEPEPFGRVILEGMALGRTMVATNIGGPAEMIEDGVSGFLVPPNDPEALAQKIDYLLEHPERRDETGRAATIRVERKFRLEDTVKNMEQLYSTIFQNNGLLK